MGRYFQSVRLSLLLPGSAAVLALVVAASCSDPAGTPNTANTLTCGAGTHQQDSACVLDSQPNTTKCGDGTQLVNGACVPSAPPIKCGDGTQAVNGVCVPTALTPGAFDSPIVLLKDAQGTVNHMHVNEMRYRASDGKLIYCSYTFGVIDGTSPDNMTYLAQNLKHVVPGTKKSATGACLHLAVDTNNPDIVYVTHRGNIDNEPVLTGWILHQDPMTATKIAPTQLPVLQETNISYEGIDTANGHIFVALRGDGLGVYDRNPNDNTVSRIGSLGGFTNAWQVRVVGNTAFIADSLGGLVTVDVTDARNPKLIGRLDVHGTARDVTFDANAKVAYVAAGAQGFVAVDISDLANMKILSTTDTPGMALQVGFAQGRVTIADWNDVRTYDVTAPATPRFIGAARAFYDLGYPQDDRAPVTDRVMGVAVHDDIIFSGVWHYPRSYRVHADRVAPNVRLPEDINLLDFGPTMVGQSSTVPFEITNQGTAALTVTNIWSDNADFTITPTQTRIDAGKTGTVMLKFTPKLMTQESAQISVVSDDPVQPVRKGYLVGNMAGAGVGVPLPRTKITLVDNSEWDSASPDVQGHVTVLAFFATFCPVCGTELPDIEEELWRPYKSKGLLVAAADCGGSGGSQGKAYTDDLPGLVTYVNNLHVTYPIGLQDPSTLTYLAFANNYQGANPFPIDVIIDKKGIVRYVAREHDAPTMVALIEQLLAE